MISAWDTFFEVDDYYTYKKPVGHGAYGVVISALDTRDNSKVRENERTGGESLRGCSDCSRRSIHTRLCCGCCVDVVPKVSLSRARA